MIADCSGVIGVSGGQFCCGLGAEAGAPSPLNATAPGVAVPDDVETGIAP